MKMGRTFGVVVLGGLLAYACGNSVKGRATAGDGDSSMGGDVMGNGDGDGDGGGGGNGSGDGDGTGGVGGAGSGSDCTTDPCGSSAPICAADSKECRECGSNQECEDLGTGANICKLGACIECTENDECSEDSPVCGSSGACRACRAHDECGSLACDLDDGTCVPEAEIVYVLATTGLLQPGCGSRNEPCRRFEQALPELNASRRTIVMIPTTQVMEDSATFPSIDGITVIGHDVEIDPFSSTAAFTVPAGGNVTLDGVFTKLKVDCTDATLNILRSKLDAADYGLFANGCHVNLQESSVEGAGVGVSAGCSGGDCVTSPIDVVVERTRFSGNQKAFEIRAHSAVVRNNILSENGQDEYEQVGSFSTEAASEFSYNTLWGNWQNCVYIGVWGYDANVDVHSNISWDSFPDWNGEGDNCYAQVFYGGGNPRYTIAETTWPGEQNEMGDPLFVDAAGNDFHLMDGSPALDAGDPNKVPSVDFYGNPRAVGDGPDRGAIEMQ